MKLLISNDDGIHSAGLAALADALGAIGEVVVVAPDREQSACSHALTLHRPLRIDEMCFHFLAVPSWNRMLQLPHDERVALLSDPAARDELRHAVENYNRDPALGTTTPPPMWTTVTVDHVAR